MLLCNLLVVSLYDKRMVSRLADMRAVFSPKEIRRLLFVCAPLMVNALLSVFANMWPRLQLEKHLGAEAMGIYSSVLVPMLLIQVVASIVAAPLMGVYAGHYARGDRRGLELIVVKTLAGVLLAAGCFIGGILLFGEWALVLVFGEGIRAYAGLMPFMGLVTAAAALVWILTGVCTVMREMRGVVAAGLLGCAAALPASALVGGYAMDGANLALLAVQLAQLIALAVFVIKGIFQTPRTGRASPSPT
jgi:O-antigen/teichoic acid export membrane protein